MLNNIKKKRATIFLEPSLRDRLKEIAKSHQRTIVGQIEFWLEKEKKVKQLNSETPIGEFGKDSHRND